MILSFGLIFFVGIIFGIFFKKMGLPSLIGYIIAGIILGPNVLDLLSEQLYAISSELRAVALVIIIIRAGLALDINDLQKNGRVAILLSFIPAMFEMFFMSLIVYAVFKVTYLESLLIGIVISAVSPAVIIPRMLNLMKKGSRRIKVISQMIIASCSVEDVLIIFVFTSLLHAITNNQTTLLAILTLPVAIFIGIVTGVLLAVCLNFLYRRWQFNKNIITILMFACSFLLISFEESINNLLPFSALLAILTLGIRILYLDKNLAKDLSETFKNLWFAGELLLFVLVGIAVDLNYFADNFIIILGCIVFALFFRMIGVTFSLFKSELNYKERLFTVFSLIPKATVQAAIGAVPLAYGLEVGNLVLSFAVISIIITAPLGAVLIDFSAKKLLK